MADGSNTNPIPVSGLLEIAITNLLTQMAVFFKRNYHSEYVDGVLTAKIMNESGFVLEIYVSKYDSDGTLLSYSYGKPGDVKPIMKLLSVTAP